jgi:hypothetical protein
MPIFGLVNFAGLFSFFLLTFVCRTPMFIDTQLVKGRAEDSITKKIYSIICYIAAREMMVKDTNQN